MDETASVRIDRWLWAARFYRTRSLAKSAVAGGKVHVDDQRVKPAKELRIGQTVRINKDGVVYSCRANTQRATGLGDDRTNTLRGDSGQH